MRRFAPALLLLPLLACGDDDGSSFPAATADKAIANYKTLVNANYTDALTTATSLKAAVAALVATPSQATQDAAKKAWIDARVPYAPSEAFRFYDGPIDDPDNGPEGLINSWPLDENYIDYTRDDANAGIINDVAGKPNLSDEIIKNANLVAGEKAISTGYHAIEFLLWGQDDKMPGTGAGKRPFTDYATSEGTASNQARRGQYLNDVADLLVMNLTQVADQWKPGVTDNFAAKFGVTPSEPGADAKKQAIGDMLKSIGSMAKAELSGERMTVAFKSKDQEDEHSCFSDNTSADLYGNGLGIQNVWLGRYNGIDGVGVDEVVAAVDPALAQRTSDDLQAALLRLNSLVMLQNMGKPFDVVIASDDNSDERATMLAAIKALKAVAADVEACSKALGLEVELEMASEEI